MYADKMTHSMESAISETNRRRAIQKAYNEEHGIIPTTIKKGIRDVIEATSVAEEGAGYMNVESMAEEMPLEDMIHELKLLMIEAAETLQFEKAAQLRDKIAELEKKKR